MQLESVRSRLEALAHLTTPRRAQSRLVTGDRICFSHTLCSKLIIGEDQATCPAHSAERSCPAGHDILIRATFGPSGPGPSSVSIYSSCIICFRLSCLLSVFAFGKHSICSPYQSGRLTSSPPFGYAPSNLTAVTHWHTMAKVKSTLPQQLRRPVEVVALPSAFTVVEKVDLQSMQVPQQHAVSATTTTDVW